jgi:hypothetical protein
VLLLFAPHLAYILALSAKYFYLCHNTISNEVLKQAFRASLAEGAGIRRSASKGPTAILSASWVWALPFLSGLSPSKCQAEERSKRHEKLTD